jgi:hypothetical protein
MPFFQAMLGKISRLNSVRIGRRERQKVTKFFLGDTLGLCEDRREYVLTAESVEVAEKTIDC